MKTASVSAFGEARQILDRAVHHQLAVVQQQQQPQIELGDEARQPGEEQAGHGREAWHQLARSAATGRGGERLEFLVRQHLVFAHISQRRDHD